MVDKIMMINEGDTLHAGGQRKPLPPTPSHAQRGGGGKHIKKTHIRANTQECVCVLRSDS